MFPGPSWLLTVVIILAGALLFLFLSPLLLRLRLLLLLLPGLSLLGFVLLLLLFLPVIAAFFRLLRLWLRLFLTLTLLLLFLVVLLLLLFFILLLTFMGRFFERAEAYLAYYICKAQVCFFRFANHHFHGFELFRFYALLVQLADLFYTGDGERVLFVTTVVAIPHQVLEDIPFLQGGNAPGSFDGIGVFGEVFQRIQVSVKLVVEAAFEAAALP